MCQKCSHSIQTDPSAQFQFVEYVDVVLDLGSQTQPMCSWMQNNMFIMLIIHVTHEYMYSMLLCALTYYNILSKYWNS